MRRPNVLLIMTDQHRAMSTGAYGSAEVLTPHLDRLAARSVVFDRAYCAYPQCVASRQSMITGQYPNTHGAYGIDLKTIDYGQWTLQRAFTDAGYHTVLVGHPHMNETGFADSRTYKQYFDTVLTDAQRRQVRAAYEDHPYVEAARYAGPEDHTEPYRSATYTWQEAARFLGQWTASRDADRAAGRETKPFYAWVTFQKPHPPFNPPSRFWKRYEPRGLTLPPVDPSQPRHPFWPEWIMREDMVRNYLHGYYACISYADWCAGQILAEADRLGLWRDTVVIYTSDHGESAGWHGAYEKHCFYEPAIRVPLVIRTPGGQPGRVAELVELVDLAPTLTGMCDVGVGNHHYEGESLEGLLGGSAEGWKNRVLCEFEGGGPPRRWGRMLLEANLKCCIEGNMPDPRSLFDLRDDPEETDNLWADPAYRDRRDRMVRLIEHDWKRRKYAPPGPTA